jgi:NADH dehydrogenase
VCLIDRAPTVAPEFGPRAREVIESALDGLGVARRCGTAVAGAGAAAVTMQGGARVQADLTIWAVGPRAHPLYGRLGLPVDASGRVLADEHLATSADGVWVAGDGARVAVDGAHDAPMSCQHAIPQGRLAGANAVARALGASIGSYRQPLYLTCLDLGAAGALVTEGFERNRILATGAQAKAFNNYINRCGIYPPAGARALYRAGRARPAGRFGAALQRRLLASAAVRRAVIAGGTDRAADHGAAAAL